MRILLVEDDFGIREALKDGLQFYGHQVTAVGTVSAALDALRRLELEAVVSDGSLPAGPYNETQEWGPELLAMARGMGLRTVLFSADSELVSQERRAGGRAVLKPAGLIDLVNELEDT